LQTHWTNRRTEWAPVLSVGHWWWWNRASQPSIPAEFCRRLRLVGPPKDSTYSDALCGQQEWFATVRLLLLFLSVGGKNTLSEILIRRNVVEAKPFRRSISHERLQKYRYWERDWKYRGPTLCIAKV